MVIKRDLQIKDSNTSRYKKPSGDSIKIFFNLNYSGGTAERMVKSCTKELYKIFKREINVKFVTHTMKLQICRSLEIQKINHRV